MGKGGLETISKVVIRPFSGKEMKLHQLKRKKQLLLHLSNQSNRKFKVVINKTPKYWMGFIQTYSRILRGNDNT